MANCATSFAAKAQPSPWVGAAVGVGRLAAKVPAAALVKAWPLQCPRAARLRWLRRKKWLFIHPTQDLFDETSIQTQTAHRMADPECLELCPERLRWQ
ncbi:MAG: hypothetical protein OHK0048_08110 [Rhodoferax sp.]